MTPEVQYAVQEINDAFPSCRLDSLEDGQGGAFVTIHDVPLESALYHQATSWFGFHITHTYPYADVYPHFVRHDLCRKDAKTLGEGTSIGSYRGTPAVQISRRTNRLDPALDTALLKLCKVLRWLITRP
jgi:hypothetical protein